MNDNLPPLPFESVVVDGLWEEKYGPYTAEAMILYGQLCRQQALQEAANECERMMMYPGGRQLSAAHDNVWQAAKAIRNMK